MALLRQHLIDPEICIRCGTCEETCPTNAISHNDDNYVVDAAICKYCMDCIAPCPTGSIDEWRVVEKPYSLEEQLGWDELPKQQEFSDQELEEGSRDAIDQDAAALLATAHPLEDGKSKAPASAAKPSINLYNASNPAIARVSGNFRITADTAENDIRHIILDFGSAAFPVLEGQCIGILPPGKDKNGKPHQMRLYSVSSSRDGERPNHNNLALTVKREVTEIDGQVFKGVGSNYMCDLKRGDEVRVTGPYGATFLMANDPEANIIMICTGTGSAPFRAFTERRRRAMRDATGKFIMFFGARLPEELPYFGPLRKVPTSLLDKELVYSRIPGQTKEYVQDRMRIRVDDLAALLKDDKTHIYVCGLKGMESGVSEAFADICRIHDLEWENIRAAMQSSGRYHVETY
ncbi:MAG: benzoyl-CoA 2,3-epoxidase subunit BoxA [Fimbriimonadaceae bacterium]|nr:benzoyl-CoA 2,3-epoxidase subunit BoxA [Alphaproteobacteria bacterium]